MAKNPYEVLGVNDNATRQEIYDAYHDLKLKYSSERFMEGEIGNNASRMLSEIEQAYNDCMHDIESKVVIEETGSSYGKIAALIKDGLLNDAQSMLDAIENRTGEWHYYQSVIYYKRDWVNESQKQLDIACALDPSNEKYTKAREKMKQANKKDAQGVPNMDETRGGYTQPQGNPAAGANACCDGCCALMCCDSCCECCGGDLISCC